jgi:hypothetical protein
MDKPNFSRFTTIQVYLPLERLGGVHLTTSRPVDDRWSGYHDPVTGIRLPYNPPKRESNHYHPEGVNALCGACIQARMGSRER